MEKVVHSSNSNIIIFGHMTDEQRAQIEPEFNRALDLRQNNPNEAIQILEQLDHRFPGQAIITGMLGSIYHSLGDWVNALRYYRRTVALSPKSELASLGLFHSLRHHERFEEAFDEARRFIKLNGITEDYRLLMQELDEHGTFD
jgi:tetratricopeptide (TPR) repeat protein